MYLFLVIMLLISLMILKILYSVDEIVIVSSKRIKVSAALLIASLVVDIASLFIIKTKIVELFIALMIIGSIYMLKYFINYYFRKINLNTK